MSIVHNTPVRIQGSASSLQRSSCSLGALTISMAYVWRSFSTDHLIRQSVPLSLNPHRNTNREQRQEPTKLTWNKKRPTPIPILTQATTAGKESHEEDETPNYQNTARNSYSNYSPC